MCIILYIQRHQNKRDGYQGKVQFSAWFSESVNKGKLSLHEYQLWKQPVMHSFVLHTYSILYNIYLANWFVSQFISIYFADILCPFCCTTYFASKHKPSTSK